MFSFRLQLVNSPSVDSKMTDEPSGLFAGRKAPVLDDASGTLLLAERAMAGFHHPRQRLREAPDPFVGCLPILQLEQRDCLGELLRSHGSWFLVWLPLQEKKRV